MSEIKESEWVEGKRMWLEDGDEVEAPRIRLQKNQHVQQNGNLQDNICFEACS